MQPPLWPQLLLQVILIAINAYFAATEIAVISLNEAVIRHQAEEGDKKAARLLHIVEQPTGFLSTIQIGITLAGFLGSAFAADNLAGRLSQWFAAQYALTAAAEAAVHTLSVILITIILSFFTLVFGELVPKRVAMKKSEQVARFTCGVVAFLAAVMRPLIWLLTVSTNAVLRLVHIDPNEEDDEVSEEGIRMMVDIGEEKGAIQAGEKEMIENIFEFDNMTAGDVMIHRTDMVMLWVDDTAEEIAQDTSRDGVELYYLPAEGAQANQKYALVIGGNAIVVSAEIREGISTAWNLHEMGYPVFVLRYRIGMKASNNAPLQDVVRAVQYITEHAGQFGVQAEDYAIVSYSSGGQIAGLFGTDAVGYKNYGLPKPGAMLLGYPVNTFLEFKPVYNILLDPGVCKQRYYKMTLSDYITPDYPPTYHWYGKNDMTLMTMCWSAQGPVLEKALARNHVTHIYHVYDDAPHAVAAGKGTDAEGWLNEAVAFWEEQVG